MMEQRNIRVMVVDDSAFMRKIMGDIVESQKDMVLVSTARNGEDALKKIKLHNPDVITLDVEMPGLDGFAALQKIMRENPLPVIMVSSLTRKGSEITVEALSEGAVDFATKPSQLKGEGMEEFKELLSKKIRHAASAASPSRFSNLATSRDFSSIPSKIEKLSVPGRVIRCAVAIGASTGGPKAIEEIMRKLPADLPAAVFITQHMPPKFTESLAKRLDRVSPINVVEVSGKEEITEGRGYIARGGYHLTALNETTVSLDDTTPPVQHVRPSADVMMSSIADVFGAAVIGVILTGMGRDGSDGMARIKEMGGKTIVQDPSSSVISSMPQSVINRGMADIVAPLSEISSLIIRMVK